MPDSTPADVHPDVEDDLVPTFESEGKVPAKGPRIFVAGDTFIARTEDEGDVRIRLRFKTKLIRAIRDTGDEIDQIFALLDGIGDQKTAEQLNELDVFETTEIVGAFFRAYTQRQGSRSMGESGRSSK